MKCLSAEGGLWWDGELNILQVEVIYGCKGAAAKLPPGRAWTEPAGATAIWLSLSFLSSAWHFGFRKANADAATVNADADAANDMLVLVLVRLLVGMRMPLPLCLRLGK